MTKFVSDNDFLPNEKPGGALRPSGVDTTGSGRRTQWGVLTLYRQYKHIGLDVYGSAQTGPLSMTQLRRCLHIRGRESGPGDVTVVLTDRA